MKAELYISIRPWRTAAAVVEDGRCVELAIERPGCEPVAGNIYLGRVARILPGMDGAFVELPGVRPGLIHARDVHHSYWKSPWSASAPPIGHILSPGQLLIVQPIREPAPGKGPRLTTKPALPGRWVVFTPLSGHIGVSRRITNPQLRKHLAEMLGSLAPPGAGFVVRTAAVAASEQMLREEAQELVAKWEEIRRAATQGGEPRVLWANQGLALRCLREAPPEVERVVCDCPEAARELSAALKRMLPGARLELVQPKEQLLEVTGIMAQVRRAMRPRVWLKGGGYIVLERTEALTVVDVNTARNTSGTTHAQTILQTNLEAARTIAWVLRLRNIGGVVVIDFVDMAEAAHKQRVIEELEQALAPDHAPTKVLGMTSLGLVELTRKRLGPALEDMLEEPCGTCQGKGRVVSSRVACENLLEELMNLGPEVRGKELVVEANPRVVQLLEGPYKQWLKELAGAGGWSLRLVASPQPRAELYRLSWN